MKSWLLICRHSQNLQNSPNFPANLRNFLNFPCSGNSKPNFNLEKSPRRHSYKILGPSKQACSNTITYKSESVVLDQNNKLDKGLKLQVFKSRPQPQGVNPNNIILEESEPSKYRASSGGNVKASPRKGAKGYLEKLSSFSPSIKESRITRKIESRILSKKEFEIKSKKTLGSSKYRTCLSQRTSPNYNHISQKIPHGDEQSKVDILFKKTKEFNNSVIKWMGGLYGNGNPLTYTGLSRNNALTHNSGHKGISNQTIEGSESRQQYRQSQILNMMSEQMKAVQNQLKIHGKDPESNQHSGSPELDAQPPPIEVKQFLPSGTLDYSYTNILSNDEKILSEFPEPKSQEVTSIQNDKIKETRHYNSRPQTQVEKNDGKSISSRNSYLKAEQRPQEMIEISLKVLSKLSSAGSVDLSLKAHLCVDPKPKERKLVKGISYSCADLMFDESPEYTPQKPSCEFLGVSQIVKFFNSSHNSQKIAGLLEASQKPVKSQQGPAPYNKMKCSVQNNLGEHTTLNDQPRQDMYPCPNSPNFGTSPNFDVSPAIGIFSGSETSDEPSKDLNSKWNQISECYNKIQRFFESLIQEKKNFNDQQDKSHGDRSDPNNGRALTTKRTPKKKKTTFAPQGTQHTPRIMIYGRPKFNDILDNVEKEETYKKFSDSQSKNGPSLHSDNGDTSKTGLRTIRAKCTHVHESLQSKSLKFTEEVDKISKTVPLKVRRLHINLAGSHDTGELVSQTSPNKRKMTETSRSLGFVWTPMSKLANQQKSLIQLLGSGVQVSLKKFSPKYISQQNNLARGQTKVVKEKITVQSRNYQIRTVHDFSDLCDEKIPGESNAHPNTNIETKVRKYSAHPNTNFETEQRKYNAHSTTNFDRSQQALKKPEESQSSIGGRKSKRTPKVSGPRILFEPSDRKSTKSSRWDRKSFQLLQTNAHDHDLLEGVEREETYVKNVRGQDGKSSLREVRSLTSSPGLHMRFCRARKVNGVGGLAILHGLSKSQSPKDNVEGIAKSEQNQLYYFLVFKNLDLELKHRNQSY